MQHILLANTVFLAVCLWVLTTKWPTAAPSTSTFSEHAATNRASVAWYCFMFAATHLCIVLFMSLWFIPTFSLPPPLIFPVALIFILQTACTLVPYRPGTRQHTVHLALALSGAAMIPASLIMMLTLPSTLSVTHDIALILALGVLALTILWSLIVQKRIVKIAQLIYYLCFFVPLLFIVYV